MELLPAWLAVERCPVNKIHLFPTFVGQEIYQDSQRFKSVVFDSIDDHLSDDGYSNEMTGHLTLHHDIRFAKFFEFATRSAMEYVSCLSIDPSIYDFNVVKSWFNITKETNNPVHTHSDAHLSFVYYISTPHDVQKMLCFFVKDSPNELYKGMEDNIRAFNVENSASWSLVVNEGELYLFPANLAHGVIASKEDITGYGVKTSVENDDPVRDITKFRVAIAGDIVLTHREKTLVHMGLQPIKNWRTF